MEGIKRYEAIEPAPLDLLREPLVWFFAEHYRHREVCARLLTLSTAVAFDESALSDVRSFMERDLPVHIIDEEDDLFPLLRRRCEPDDQIEKVLGMLSGEHANDMRDAAAVKALVTNAVKEKRGLACYRETRAMIEPFCSQQKRHIAVENAVILPIARLRLTDSDLKNLGRRLAARRGLDDPFTESR